MTVRRRNGGSVKRVLESTKRYVPLYVQENPCARFRVLRWGGGEWGIVLHVPLSTLRDLPTLRSRAQTISMQATTLRVLRAEQKKLRLTWSADTSSSC